MKLNPRTKYIKLLLLAVFLVLLVPRQAQAYIGPGAGFAVMGSFMVMFTAILSGLLAIFTWPLRSIIRAILRRRAFAKSSVRKVVILGLDGMDYALTNKMLEQGKLPNLQKLKNKGCFKPLATTIPSISPVAWSSFQTGVNPGKHNIFDFLTRDKKTYMPILSSVDIRGPRKTIRIGKYKFGIGKPDIRLCRKGKPFWITLGEHGIFSNILRVPITFPPEKFRGVQLSGMCVPDLRGTQGMFSFYTTASNHDTESTGGENFHVTRTADTIESHLVGCDNPLKIDSETLKLDFKVTIKEPGKALIQIDGQKIELKKNVYTNWIKIKFKPAPGIKVNGICKFLLISTEPQFQLYVTPINIDPEKPAMPISYPTVFSTYLAKNQGPYATLGLAEDTWALNEKVLDDQSFIEQCMKMDQEREKMFFDSIDKVREGLCVCVFDGTDRIQHTFWRDIEEDHPANNEYGRNKGRNAVEELYMKMDDLVARTIKKCSQKDTMLMIVSDHGFNSFRRGIDLNRWLEENGYLFLKDGKKDAKYLADIDWSKTQAYAIGLSGIFLNLKGRESKGIVDPDTQAENLREQIAEKLKQLIDPQTDQPAIKQVYNALKVYTGPYKNEAPDLLVGYNRGYRASWETAIGQVTDSIFADNTKAWSGDHCIDPSLVPGVLFCDRNIDTQNPRLMDIGPTVLNMFGISVPKYMDGKALTVTKAKTEK